MNKKELNDIKSKIYQQVEQIDNETTLQMLQEAVTAYSSPSNKDILDELSPEQQQRLNKSIQQANDGKTLSNEDVKQNAKEWLSVRKN